MAAISQKEAARRFAKTWEGRGSETKDDRQFWLQLLMDVFRIDNPFSIIEFQKPVKMESSTKFIDGFISSTRVLIEQKGIDVDLTKRYRQSDGAELTPYEQARRYDQYMLPDEHPHWIVVSNFKSFEIHDMNRPYDEPVVILLKDLPNEYSKLSFITDAQRLHIQHEKQVSLDAGKIVGRLYDALSKQYVDPDSERSKHSLNVLCVRFVFCLYAEDAGVFLKDQFHDYLKDIPVEDMREAVLRLFEVLDTPGDKRSPYLKESLKAFPYTNGGLFHDRDIEVPMFTEEIKDVLVQHASDDFDWSSISPTIFGAVFESTLNPETRRGNGMHYTSIENIHKVIDPLFLDGLKEDLQAAKDAPATKRRQELRNFQERISELTFLDPACGSGNFLTETYLSLRRLENEVIRELAGDSMLLGMEDDLIKVKISQLYGIEINDFAADVARTALWISEAQMMEETKNIVQKDMDFLPLKSNTNIHTGNALRMDWNEVIDAQKLSYLESNPPFIGARWLTSAQREDIKNIFGPKWKNAGILDYVCCWYKKSFDYMNGARCRAALVSTNSITQGEHVAAIWKPLFEMGFHFDFAHRTFIWDSEASEKAHVHCVILGFSTGHSERQRRIYDPNGFTVAQNINGYLLDAPDVFIESRVKPLCDVPEIRKGNQPTDGGNLIIEKEDYDEFIKKEPAALPYIKRFYGAKEYLNNIPRYCLWLVNVPPSQLKAMPAVMDRVTKVREIRLASSDPGTHRLADTPAVFRETNNPEHAIVIPEVSSERRRYVPMSFVGKEVICSNKLQIIPDANLYEFGVLESSVHMAWMRVVCGRLEMRYDYSKKIVYNNFPWPATSISESTKWKIEQTAQAILDARALYPTDSLADLYDETVMPTELRKAHRANDAAVMEAYGFQKDMTESEIVADLFKLYEKLTENSVGK